MRIDSQTENAFGRAIVERAELLAAHSDQTDALTVMYLTPAHRAAAAQIAAWMREAGCRFTPTRSATSSAVTLPRTPGPGR